MKYIALEEAFAIPDLADRQPKTTLKIRVSPELARRGQAKLADFTEYRIPEMDDNGIDIQVLSLTVPGIQADIDPRSATDNAVYANDFLAEVIAKNPDRFRGFAALPMQDPESAIKELRRCIDELGFCGALVNDHTQGHYLDEPQYEDFWSELEGSGLPLYIHPGSLPMDDWHVLHGHPELYGATWSWAAETGAHALRLIYGGVFDRHPGATVILGHMGEFLPFQISRFDSRYRTLVTDQSLDRKPSEYFGKNVVVTTSGVFAPAALTGAIMAIGADSIMFSIDYPYESTAEAVQGFEQTPLSIEDREKISHTNAERILKI